MARIRGTLNNEELTGDFAEWVGKAIVEDVVTPFRINPGRITMPQPIRIPPSGTLQLDVGNVNMEMMQERQEYQVPITGDSAQDVTDLLGGIHISDNAGNFNDLKVWAENQGTYTIDDINDVVANIQSKFEEKIQKLEQKITDLQETNTEILKGVKFICERKKKAQNLQIR